MENPTLNILQQVSKSNKNKASLRHYGIAILTVATAVLLTSLSSTLSEKSPYMMFYAAVTLSAWYGGLWPGIMATVLGALSANYFFIQPIDTLDFGWSDIVSIGVFTQVSLLSSSLSAARKRNIEILLAAQELFQSFMNNSPILTFMKDEEGRYIYINQRMETVFNRKQAEWIGKTDFDIWPDKIANQFYKHDCAAKDKGKTVEQIETLYLNNELSHWMALRFPFIDTSGRCLLAGILIDVTERRNIEQVLKNTLENLSKAKFEWESTVNAFPEIIFLIDGKRNILRANQAFEKWDLGLLASIYNQDFHKALHPLCQSASCYLEKIVEELLLTSPKNGYLERELQDDLLKRYLSVTLTLIQQTPEENKNTEQNFVLVLRDITKLHTLQQASKRRTRFETMEYLVGRLAHQIGNPLAAMKTTAQVWSRNFDKISTTKQTEYLEKIIDRINHIESIISTIMTGQGWKIKSMTSVAVTEILRQVQITFEDQMYANKIDFKVINVGITDCVLGNLKAIEEVFAVVLKNSIEACREGDEITIKTTTNETTVCFSVDDTGSGINKSSLENIFNPFYTTKSNGSGIGLAHANQLMEQMDGSIKIESSENLGTKVKLTFVKASLAHSLIKETIAENLNTN